MNSALNLSIVIVISPLQVEIPSGTITVVSVMKASIAHVLVAAMRRTCKNRVTPYLYRLGIKKSPNESNSEMWKMVIMGYAFLWGHRIPNRVNSTMINRKKSG